MAAQNNKSPIFFGCYLLLSQSKADQTYIGFTVNPKRRLRQHNRDLKGGADQTEKYRPWEMVLVVHGFPNRLVSLQFEWAWQNPQLSRHFKAANSQFAKSAKKTLLNKIKILMEMLHLSCWTRLGLTVTILDQRYADQFRDVLKQEALPSQMKLITQSVDEMPFYFSSNDDEECIFDLTGLNDDQLSLNYSNTCAVCSRIFSDEERDFLLMCNNENCSMASHLICLAKVFLQNEKTQLQPREGQCPSCKMKLVWGHLIVDLQVRRQKRLQDKEHQPMSISSRLRFEEVEDT